MNPEIEARLRLYFGAFLLGYGLCEMISGIAELEARRVEKRSRANGELALRAHVIEYHEPPPERPPGTEEPQARPRSKPRSRSAPKRQGK